MGASVVACCDASPVLELGEEVLDLVPLAIECLVVGKGFLPALRGRDARLDAPIGKSLAEPCAVIAPVGDQASGRWQGIEDEAAIFETYQQLLDQPEGSLTGKIAIVLQDTVQAQDGRGYGATSPIRGAGPTEAARRGALGTLTLSTPTSERTRPFAKGNAHWRDTSMTWSRGVTFLTTS